MHGGLLQMVNRPETAFSAITQMVQDVVQVTSEPEARLPRGCLSTRHSVRVTVDSVPMPYVKLDITIIVSYSAGWSGGEVCNRALIANRRWWRV
jgi:hypothetical protein